MELTPQRLVKTFGQRSLVAQKTIDLLVTLISQSPSFQRWQHLYNLASGSSFKTPEEQYQHFAVHTYFAIIAKVLAFRRLASSWPSTNYQTHMRRIESGKVFAAAGIEGFEPDTIFNWYLSVWNKNLATAIATIFQQMGHFDRFGRGDILKRLYLSLVPRSLRHRLGEYYTPDWLATYVLQQICYDLDATLLDPACGSGTFLMMATQVASDRGLGAAEVAERVVGFDINPLAVLAARVNYILAFGPGSYRVPIYQKDTILEAASDHNFDYVVGNPPWINWQVLPSAYRDQTKQLWQDYGLFPHQGLDTILGKGKKDLSMLMTMIAVDRYLAPTGKLGFVITQSVFKTSGAGQGFRRFRLSSTMPIRVECVDDMSAIYPFNDAGSRTAVVVMSKGEPTTYPVPYRVWKRAQKSQQLRHYYPLTKILDRTERHEHVAVPVDADDPGSAWLTGMPSVIDAIRAIVGPADYQAHEGINSGGANGVYWLEVKEQAPDDRLQVCNMVGAKGRMDTVEATLEAMMVYPMLRGRDVQRWQAISRHHMLVVQNPETRIGYDETWMRRNLPQTYAYLKRFEDVLWARRSFRRYFRPTVPFYTMFGVGHYTFAPYKVVWRYIANEMTAAVVTTCQDKVVVADHRLMLIAVDSLDEAHFVAACLNNTISRFIVAACTIFTQISTHVMQKVPVPRYNADNDLHRELVELSRAAHVAVEQHQSVVSIEAQLDQAIIDLWGLNQQVLDDIR